jgi:hypothetical protein
MSEKSKPTAPSNQEPLNLSVHAMPVPKQTDSSLRNGRLKMLAVLFMCAAPVLASYFTYYVIRPEGRHNFGALINPQRPIPALATTTLDGKAGEFLSLKGQWLLISVAGAACDEACQQRLYLQRQMRELLGREKDRVERVWLITDDVAVDPRLKVGLDTSPALRVSADSIGQWLQPAAGHQIDEHLYLVDPMGNWMMRFPANMDVAGASKAKNDLKRLLTASSSWDKVGR